MASTLIDPDSFLNIAKNLDAKTFENLAQTNRHYKWAYEQIKQCAYKHFLKRDFNHKLTDTSLDAKDVYKRAFTDRPQITVLFEYTELDVFVSTYDEQLPRGFVFNLNQFSLNYIQTTIFNTLKKRDIFETSHNGNRIDCEVYLDYHAERRNHFIEIDSCILTDILMIKVPKGENNPSSNGKMEVILRHILKK